MKAIIKDAELLVEDFNSMNTIVKQPVPPRTQGWSPPIEGWCKVNVDGVVFRESSSYGIGVVIRNE